LDRNTEVVREYDDQPSHIDGAEVLAKLWMVGASLTNVCPRREPSREQFDTADEGAAESDDIDDDDADDDVEDMDD